FFSVVEKQYQKKFGRLGEAVIKSNMEVMRQGMERCVAVPHGAIDAEDRSPLRGAALLPIGCGALSHGTPSQGRGTNGHGDHGNGVQAPRGYHDADTTVAQPERAPIHQAHTFDDEFRSHFGYHQPASVLASVGMMAPATGATQSKFVARRLT